MERIPDNSLMVVCGDEVLVAAVHNATATDDGATESSFLLVESDYHCNNEI